jgi:hypothetical protein
MTPEQFDAALTELEWKGSDFCARAGLVPNTVWRWRKSLAPIPPWVGEYLRAVLAVQRLHAEFVAVRRPVRQVVAESAAGPGAGAEEPAE